MLEATQKRLAEDVLSVRENVHELRNDMQPLALTVDRLAQNSARRGKRGADAAIWAGVIGTLLVAVGSLWLAWATARAQPDASTLARAIAAELDSRGGRR